MAKPRKTPKYRLIQPKTTVSVEEVDKATRQFFQQFLEKKEHSATIYGYVYGDKRVEYHNHEHLKIDENGNITEPDSLSELYAIRQAVRNRNKIITITVTEHTGEFSHNQVDEEGNEFPLDFVNIRSWVILGESIKPQSASEAKEASILDPVDGDEIELNPANRFYDAWELSSNWLK